MKYTDYKSGIAEVNIKDGKEMAEAMSDFVNNFSIDDKAFIGAMGQRHRTLQQSFTRLCYNWLEQLAFQYDNGFYDDRNKASCEFAKKVVEQYKDRVFFPMI